MSVHATGGIRRVKEAKSPIDLTHRSRFKLGNNSSPMRFLGRQSLADMAVH